MECWRAGVRRSHTESRVVRGSGGAGCKEEWRQARWDEQCKGGGGGGARGGGGAHDFLAEIPAIRENHDNAQLVVACPPSISAMAITNRAVATS